MSPYRFAEYLCLSLEGAMADDVFLYLSAGITLALVVLPLLTPPRNRARRR